MWLRLRSTVAISTSLSVRPTDQGGRTTILHLNCYKDVPHCLSLFDSALPRSPLVQFLVPWSGTLQLRSLSFVKQYAQAAFLFENHSLSSTFTFFTPFHPTTKTKMIFGNLIAILALFLSALSVAAIPLPLQKAAIARREAQAVERLYVLCLLVLERMPDILSFLVMPYLCCPAPLLYRTCL